MTEVGPDGAGRGRGDDAGEWPARHSKRQPRGAERLMSDERLADERELDERELTEDRDLTEDERLELFRDSLQQSVLPNLPEFSGYHCFWATTSNPRDSIQWRLRLGYELIKVEMFPGWDGIGVKTAGVDGVVSVNEMVAMRIPNRLYDRYMREAHHIMPLQEEEKIRSMTDGLKARAAEMGAQVLEGEGNAELVQRARPPRFVD